MCVCNTLFANHLPDTDEPGGIGLANTQRRLNLLYPGHHALRIIAPTPTTNTKYVSACCCRSAAPFLPRRQ